MWPNHTSAHLPETGFDAVAGERRMLFSLGYRLLGSVADVQDAVQVTYLRWYNLTEQQRVGIASPAAWLVKTASRSCLDMPGSARARRERYVGDWLPEPLPDHGRWASRRSTGAAADPADRVTLDESVSMALLVVLQSMTPPRGWRSCCTTSSGTRLSRSPRSSGARRRRAVSSACRQAAGSRPPLRVADVERHAEIVTVAVVSLAVTDDVVSRIWTVRNPHQLSACA